MATASFTGTFDAILGFVQSTANAATLGVETIERTVEVAHVRAGIWRDEARMSARYELAEAKITAVQKATDRVASAQALVDNKQKADPAYAKRYAEVFARFSKLDADPAAVATLVASSKP